jgi:hypothetical protein
VYLYGSYSSSSFCWVVGVGRALGAGAEGGGGGGGAEKAGGAGADGGGGGGSPGDEGPEPANAFLAAAKDIEGGGLSSLL